MTRVKRSAAILSYATLVLMSALIVTAAVFLIVPDWAVGLLVDAAPETPMLTPPTVAIIYGLQAAGWVFLGLNLFVLWQIYSLFCLYAQGEALSDRCGQHVRRIGVGLMLLPLASVFYGMVSSVLLSWNNGAGERQLTLAIDLQGLGFVVGGALLLFVGMTIREATEIAEENRRFI